MTAEHKHFEAAFIYHTMEVEIFLHALLALTGSSGEEEHWSLCIGDTESVLPFGVGAMFVRQQFDGNSKHTV